MELDRLLVREHTVARSISARARWIIRARAAFAWSDSRSACDPSALADLRQVVHHGFHAVVGDLVVHVGMRGEDSLLRVDFAAPVGLVGFGEVRLRHEPVAEHSARLQVFPKDVHHATLPEAVAGDGQGGSVMHAQRVPRRCSGRYAVGALPRLEGPAAVSSFAGWGARVSSAVPRGRAGKGRLPDVLSRRPVIGHHHVERGPRVHVRPLRAGRALLSGNEGTRREIVPRSETHTGARTGPRRETADFARLGRAIFVTHSL